MGYALLKALIGNSKQKYHRALSLSLISNENRSMRVRRDVFMEFERALNFERSEEYDSLQRGLRISL